MVLLTYDHSGCIFDPLKVETSLYWATHLCSLLWLPESKSLGTKGQSVSRKGNQANSPASSCLQLYSSLWYHFPPRWPLLTSSNPAVKTLHKSPLFQFFANHPIPLGPLPFLRYHNPSFYSSMSATRRYYPRITHWLVKGVIMTFQLERRLPEGRGHNFLQLCCSLWFALAHHREYVSWFKNWLPSGTHPDLALTTQSSAEWGNIHILCGITALAQDWAFSKGSIVLSQGPGSAPGN